MVSRVVEAVRPEALALPCEACGAPLPLQPSAPEVDCGRCGAVRRQPLEERRKLRDALWRVKERWTEVVLAWRVAAFHRQQARATPRFIACVIPAALGFLLWGIVFSGSPEMLSALPRPVSGLVALLVAGSWCGATKFMLDMYRQPPLARLLPSTLAACDRCGGPVDFSDEPAASTSCPWCTAAVVPGPALRASTLARLAVARQDVADEYAVEEAANIAAANDGVNFLRIGVVVGAAAVMAALLALADHSGSPERLAWASGLVRAVWLVGLACFVGGVASLTLSGREAGRLQQALGRATLNPAASTQPPLFDDEVLNFAPLVLTLRWEREDLRQPAVWVVGWMVYVAVDGPTSTLGWVALWAFAVGVSAWFVLLVLVRWNTATIRLDPDHLRITHGPIPWFGAVFRTRDVLNVTCSFLNVETRGGPMTASLLVVHTRDGGSVDIGWMFADGAELRRAAAELSAKLREVLPVIGRDTTSGGGGGSGRA